MSLLLQNVPISGAPIAVDLTPNASAPAAARKWAAPPGRNSNDEGSGLLFDLKDGTSVTVQLWELIDDVALVWAQLGSPFTILPAQVSLPVPVQAAAVVFAQVTAVAGAPTTLWSGFSKVPQGTLFAQYHATPATSADGQWRGLEAMSDGSLRGTEQLSPQYEDNTNAVATVAQRLLANGAYSPTVVMSAALEASHVLKASAGVLKKLRVRLDQTAGTAVFYIQILDAASLPADGAVTHLATPHKLQHTTGVGNDQLVEIDFGPNGVKATTGIVVVLSSTEFTKTIAGAFLSIFSEIG